MGRVAKLRIKRKGNGKWFIAGLWIQDPAAPNIRRRYRPEFETRQEAADEIHTIVKRRFEEGVASERLTDNDRIDAIKAKEILAPHQATLEQAARHYAKHLEVTRRSIQLNALCDEFFALKRREIELKADGHWTPDDLRDTKSRCLKFAEKFGSSWAAEITSDDIHNWLEDQKLETSAQNRKNHRKALSKLFSYAKTKKYCPTNPVRDVPGVKVPKKRPAILSPEQIQTLLDGAPIELIPYIAIGAFAGLRPTEAQRCRWQDIRPDGQIDVREDDQHDPVRHADVSVNLAKWLSLAKCSSGSVAPADADRKTANLARELKVIEGNWPQDLLRHSFGTAHACLYQDLPQTAFLMGNSVPTIKAKYLKAIPQKTALEWWKISPQKNRKALGQVSASPDAVKAFEEKLSQRGSLE